MKMTPKILLPLAGGLLMQAVALLPAHAQLPTPMMGRQSHNTGIRALPAPGPVKVDGNLDEWDLTGRIWTFADVAIRDRYSAETSAMWDKEYLYLAVRFRDPNPLVNTINPEFDRESGWKGDALQLRILTDWPSWITMWQFSGEKRNVMHIASWKNDKSARDGQDVRVLVSEPGRTDLGEGVQMAFKADEDNRGYVQEVRIPWKVLYKNAPKVEPGLTMRMGMEFFWGRNGESIWPAHRYADNLQPGETSREFFWSGQHIWGDVKLLPKGNVEVLSYIPPGQKLQGTLPIKLQIPASAKEFTVVVEGQDGSRVRNLGAQLNAEMYSVAVQGTARTVEVLWDGKDDAGKMVAPAQYRVRGLAHEGLGADYVMSFFNPGTPPWEAGPGSAWGADHGCPRLVASAGDWNIIGWSFAEGGHGVVAVGPDGLKKWGEKRGARLLAADEKAVYFISNSWHAAGNLCRLKLRDGSYWPFNLDGKERPFELSMGDVLGGPDNVPGQTSGLASSGTQLAIAFSGGKVAILDAATSKLIRMLDVPAPSGLAYGPGGRLYGISERALVEIDVTSGKLRPIATPGLDLKKPVVDGASDATEVTVIKNDVAVELHSLAVDPEGNIGIYDSGADQQVKFYTPQGKLAYTAGRKGGRPRRGDFDDQAMSHVTSVGVDKKGQIWTSENWEYPRRVSVWGRDGKLVRDYIGNTGYAGTGAFLHDNDPTLAYYGPVEMKLDLQKRTWKVNKVLWVPGPDEHFSIDPSSHTHPQRFTSQAGGIKREYMFVPPYRPSRPYVLFMEGNKGWRPVAAIGVLGSLAGKIDDKGGNVLVQPSGEYAGFNAYDGYIWNDANGDGKVQRSEVDIIKTKDPGVVGKRGKPPIPTGSGWGTRMSPHDLSFTVNGATTYKPVSYTREGAPVFSQQSIKPLEAKIANGDFVVAPKDKSLIALSWEQYFGSKGLYGLDADTGKVRWSYPNPFPGVHGSHRAPMPQPGLVIGPLKIMGVADLPKNNGEVFCLRGNLGQDYFFTTDGLMIGTVFQDGRLPNMALPAKEAELLGAPMESYGGGGEPFSGWFGGHSDGKIRLTSGMGRQVAMILEMNGFDRIQRFTGPNLSPTADQLTAAARANDEREAAARKSAEKKQTIVQVAAPLSVDGKGTSWRAVPGFNVESTASGFKAKAQLAYDAQNLYLGMDVEDPSPWKNEGIDFTRLFKTGDAVDIQLATNPAAAANRTEPAQGDLRVVFGPMGKSVAAVLMQPVNQAAPEGSRKTYVSPVGEKRFHEVRILNEAKVAVEVKGRGYRLEAAIPLAALSLKPQAGQSLRGDVGFISSDAAGRINTARTYWSSQATNLVNDEPIESWLTPATWGTFEWGK